MNKVFIKVWNRFFKSVISILLGNALDYYNIKELRKRAVNPISTTLTLLCDPKRCEKSIES